MWALGSIELPDQLLFGIPVSFYLYTVFNLFRPTGQSVEKEF